MGKLTSPVVDLNAALLLLLLAAVWGGSFFFAEVALRELSPLVITFFRVSLSVPVLLAVVVLRGVPFTRSLRVWRAYLVMGALNNAIPFSLIFWGQTHIESGLASILNGTTAMFGALVAGLLLPDEPLRANKLIGAALGLAGVAFIMGPDALQDFNLTNLAQLAILGATLSYAFASVWGKTTLAGQPPLMNALGMVVCSSGLMLPIVWLAHGVPSLAFQPVTWGALLALAVLSTALAYLLYFAILARAGAANLMLVTLMIPPFAITLGALFLSERIGIQAFAGFAVIAVGFAVTDGRFLARLHQRR